MPDRHTAADRDDLAREQRRNRIEREEKRTHMGKRIDLDALEAALAKATPGPWKWSINSKRVQVAAVRHAAQVCAVWNTSAYPATAVADAIVAAHNALPALIAELRELRERNNDKISNKEEDTQ